MRVLVTGGCGFIGHHFVEHIIKNTDWEIITLDRLSYASTGYDRLRDIDVFDDKRVHTFTHDISTPITNGLSYEIGQVDFIVHMAAETHVDSSINDARPFVRANVLGTLEMLEFARTQRNLQRFVYFGTDEVFGPAAVDQSQHDWSGKPQLLFTHHEWDRYNSTNPYAAAKAGGEEMALAYANTHGVPVIITHTMNNFAERQHPEKFFPMCIKRILQEEKIYIHANKDKTKAGSRFYIHARNAASAILFLLESTVKNRDKFNIVGDIELDNLELAQMIAEIIVKPLIYEMVDFHSSRPGHDLRYSLSGEKMKALGWVPPMDFESSLEKTVYWYIENPQWLEEQIYDKAS